MTDCHDKRLAARAARGEKAAFVSLVSRHGQALMALIRRMVPDHHHRQDVLQETLLQAWRCLPELRDGSKVRAWLVAIARNRCRDYCKSAKRRERPADGATLENYVNAMGRAVRDRAGGERLREVLHRIKPAKRRAAEMFYLDGMTIAEIAQRLNEREGTIKSRLYHARRAIQSLLEA